MVLVARLLAFLHDVPVHVGKAPLYDLFASGARGASTTDSISIISDWSSKSKLMFAISAESTRC